MPLSLSAHTILLVDGYNIIGAWPQLRKLSRRADLDLARNQLIELLSNYVAYREYQAIVVFDAYTQPQPATQLRSPTGIEIYFTNYGETADTFIERTCAQLQWEECRVRVATSDRVEQLVITGYDAEGISADQLLEEVKQVNDQIRRVQSRTPKPKRGIDRYLDANTRDRLSLWRITGSDPIRS